MGTVGIILILLALLGLYFIMHILIYNHIQVFKTRIDHVEGIIDENLREKYDLILRAEEVIKEKIAEKKEYLKELKELKEQKISNFDFCRKLSESENIVINLYHDNEQLENNENIEEVLVDLKKINEHLSALIAFYNKYTSSLNSYIRKFPNNIIAKIHHVKVRPFFDGKDLTDDDIDDFKI